MRLLAELWFGGPPAGVAPRRPGTTMSAAGGLRSSAATHGDWLARRDSGAWSPHEDAALQAWLAADAAHRVAFLRLLAAWDESGGCRRWAPVAASGPPPRAGHRRHTAWRRRRAPAAPRRAPASAPPPARPPPRRACSPGRLRAARLGLARLHRVDSVRLPHRSAPSKHCRLADGSQATLASDSPLDVRLSRRERRVELDRWRSDLRRRQGSRAPVRRGRGCTADRRGRHAFLGAPRCRRTARGGDRRHGAVAVCAGHSAQAIVAAARRQRRADRGRQ
ncbi:MAG: DUF4880 domain-containing protein [Thermomonas sp.]|nr:DUF4880 domain-containing protein [Thermomonas sp.]